MIRSAGIPGLLGIALVLRHLCARVKAASPAAGGASESILQLGRRPVTCITYEPPRHSLRSIRVSDPATAAIAGSPAPTCCPLTSRGAQSLHTSGRRGAKLSHCPHVFGSAELQQLLLHNFGFAALDRGTAQARLLAYRLQLRTPSMSLLAVRPFQSATILRGVPALDIRPTKTVLQQLCNVAEHTLAVLQPVAEGRCRTLQAQKPANSIAQAASTIVLQPDYDYSVRILSAEVCIPCCLR